MVLWALMFALVIGEYVSGKPWLPPLTMNADGCYLVTSEVNVFRVEGEPIIISFPIFKSVLRALNIAPPKARFLITKDNETGGVAYDSNGRVQQREKQLWLLPAQASDSGEYICTYRNDTYCITGNITLEVFESSSVDMEKVSYQISAMVGERLTFRCPSLSDFNSTDRLIEWYKENSSTAFQSGRAGSLRRDSANLRIPAVSCSHAGVYTCQLRVLIDQQQYKVSRVILLNVEGVPGPEPQISTTAPDVSVTSVPGRNSSSYSTDQASPPVIVSPLNGSIFESPHGSGLEMSCKVLTRCHQADSTEVKWLVNGQSVESSYLDVRALQGGRRVTKVTEGCQIELRLAVVSVTEEDVGTELKCVTQNQAGRQEVVAQLHLEDSTFTWLVVAAVAVSCFLCVVSVFLYVLFKPNRERKLDYFLARQNSTF
ncbi:interleukin-1 receptor type 2 isoform X1 [Pleuronectes platessa]|uniref:interleukin-1 receptor type 2 isoform X1 n=1 Tax=Pleuronectes platessa TaxID=8262 RepID=UPI00232A61E0|nr:interleukin-1 receptor type 2 isoform X1 [Pleuronectes platessa]